MFRSFFYVCLCMIFVFGFFFSASAQEPEEGGATFIIEENLPGFKTDLDEEKPQPKFITADVLTPNDVRPAINYYILSDIYSKFAGLITNLRLETIYGILQEDKTATVYFDYSYTSVRNKDNILYEKGKMLFMKFNSGQWFNAELSIYLMDFYPDVIKKTEQKKQQ